MIAIFGGGEIASKGIVPAVGGTLVPYEDCDVRNIHEVTRTVERLRPETVIFTAGVSRPRSVVVAKPTEYREEIETNLLGAFHVAHVGARLGVKTFVFIASLAGLYGKPDHAGYSASKAGLISLVQSLALESHDAYAISPGRVDTSMRERDYPGEDPRTRLDPLVIGGVVRDILAGQYQPGDNVVVRMRGFDQLPLEVHSGDGWREKLMVGQPKTC